MPDVVRTCPYLNLFRTRDLKVLCTGLPSHGLCTTLQTLPASHPQSMPTCPTIPLLGMPVSTSSHITACVTSEYFRVCRGAMGQFRVASHNSQGVATVATCVVAPVQHACWRAHTMHACGGKRRTTAAATIATIVGATKFEQLKYYNMDNGVLRPLLSERSK